MQLLLAYKPTNLNCKITLFKAQELLPEYIPIDDRYNYWQQYSEYPVDLFCVPGNHDTLFLVSHVNQLADTLLKCINKNKTEEVKNNV